MHVISRSALRVFGQKHPDAKTALSRWYKIVNNTHFSSFADLRKTFPSADLVGKFVVFNVGGNKIRVIASVHFNRGKVYVRHVLTHDEYDQGD
jgi:mRNA interferase HigB